MDTCITTYTGIRFDPTEPKAEYFTIEDIAHSLPLICRGNGQVKSCEGMEVSGLKKKFKDKKFAAGCSREVIANGAEMIGWELTDLFEKTIKDVQSC